MKVCDQKHGGFYVTIDLFSWGFPLTRGSNVRGSNVLLLLLASLNIQGTIAFWNKYAHFYARVDICILCNSYLIFIGITVVPIEVFLQY
jgi:hypothetical protein